MAKIMIVEDKQEIAAYLAENLERKGHSILLVTKSGEEALQYARLDPPDIILMDILLEGELDGIKAAEKIHEFLSMPIVFMTGHANKEGIERAIKTAPFGILLSPFEDYELFAAVEMALHRAQVEKKIRESEEQYRNLVEQLNAIIYSIDEKGVITYISPSVKMYGGYSASELVGRPFTDLIHPGDLPRIMGRFNDIATGKEVPIEYRVVGKSGKIYWMCSHGKPFFKGGQFAGVHGVIHDVTEARGAKEALDKLKLELERRIEKRTAKLVRANKRLRGEIKERKRREEQLRLLSYAMEQSSEGITLVDLVGKVLFINHAFAESHGYSPGDLVGKHLSIFHNAQQMQQVEDANRQVLEKGEFLGEIWHTRRDGTVFPAMMHNSLLRDEDGSPIAMIETLRDITELKKMERQLFQNEKLISLGFLVSGVAHEINNPNNFITFNIPILRDYLNELMPIIDEYQARHPDVEFFGMPYDEFREDVFRLLDNIQHGSDRITTTVSELKNFARQRSRGETRKVPVKELISKVLTICKGKINRMVNSFEVMIPDDTLEIRTDPESLEQVLINLLINAAQAADKEESQVTLQVKTGESGAKLMIIEVSDNGCGMDEQTMKRIFDPFFTTKPVGEGTGLGLSVCHRLVEQIGGHIEVESKVGKGSTFRVILPAGNWRNQD